MIGPLALYRDVALELSLEGSCRSLSGLVARSADAPAGQAWPAAIGRPAEALLPAPLAAAVVAHAADALRRGSVEPFECEVPDEGGARTFEGTTFAWRGGSMTLLRDVTERRDLARDLRETETRFRVMADSAPVMLWMAGTDGRCTYFNQGWLRFTGRTMAQELGEGWAEGIAAEDFQRAMSTYLDALVVRRAFAMEYRLRRHDGAMRWIFDQGAPRFAADGEFVGYIGSCVDVTEAKEARLGLERVTADLRRGDARTRAILESVTDAILGIDPTGRITAINPAGERLFAARATTVVGRNVREFMVLPWPPGELRAASSGPRVAELDVARADGTFFPAQVVASRPEPDDPERLSLVVRDESERRDHERDLLESCDALQQRVGRDLHDGLGQLLTGIAFLAKEIEGQVPPPAAAKAARLLELINKGVETTQSIARGLAPLHLEAMTLGDALRDLASLTRYANAITCDLHDAPLACEPDAPARTHLFLIAQEAVTNALRHGAPSRIEIELGGGATPRNVLRIADDGRGAVLPPPSRGLGLASMSQRARLIGGRLEIGRSSLGGLEIRCTW
jgi:PAS domain S-box-containing protein